MTDLLTVPEAAGLLRLKPSTIRDWRLKRRIPFVKLGGRVFLRRSDVERLIVDSLVPPKLPDDSLGKSKKDTVVVLSHGTAASGEDSDAY